MNSHTIQTFVFFGIAAAAYYLQHGIFMFYDQTKQHHSECTEQMKYGMHLTHAEKDFMMDEIERDKAIECASAQHSSTTTRSTGSHLECVLHGYLDDFDAERLIFVQFVLHSMHSIHSLLTIRCVSWLAGGW